MLERGKHPDWTANILVSILCSGLVVAFIFALAPRSSMLYHSLAGSILAWFASICVALTVIVVLAAWHDTLKGWWGAIVVPALAFVCWLWTPEFPWGWFEPIIRTVTAIGCAGCTIVWLIALASDWSESRGWKT